MFAMRQHSIRIDMSEERSDMARRSIVRYGPQGGVYHEHVNVGRSGPGGCLVAVVLAILAGVIIYATLMDPVWARHNQAAANKAHEQLSIRSSVHWIRLPKEYTYDNGFRYRVTIRAIVTNRDTKDHQVSVCVDDCLVYLPHDGNVWHTQDRVRAHGSITYSWSMVIWDPPDSPRSQPYINSIDGVRVHR